MFNWQKTKNLLKAKSITTTKIRQENLLPQSTLTKLNMLSSEHNGIDGAKEIEKKLNDYEKKNGKPFNSGMTTATIETLCTLLDCEPCDLFEYVRL